MARSPPTSSVLSWLSPAIISRRSSSAADMVSGTYCFSQFQETSMGGVRDQGSGVRDKLGGNSTYLVVRQIEQATYAVIQFTSGVFDWRRTDARFPVCSVR